MNMLSIHEVEKVSIRDIRDLDGTFSLCIRVISKRKILTEITLFSDKIETYNIFNKELEKD